MLTVTQAFSQVNGMNGSLSSTSIARKSYSIAVPATWIIDTSGKMGTDLFLFSPLAGAEDSFHENINVIFQNIKGQNYDLLRMGKESEAQLGNFVTNIQILESRLDSGAKTPYYKIRYKGKQGKYLLSVEQRYYLKDEIGYAITCTVLQETEELFSEPSKLVLDSFTFL